MRVAVLSCLLAFALAPISYGQTAYATEAAYATRFAAVHGRTALLAGNAAAGLEAWAYPLQLVSGYKPEFRYAGATTAMPSMPLLRRIVYTPEAVERTYVGPDFVVHERLFVPRELPGIRITYTVEGPRAIEVLVRFKPVLDLMWPIAIGGQQVLWLPEEKAYRLDEPTHRFVALVGSPDAVLHDDLPNTNAPLTNDPQLTLTLQPVTGGKAVRVVMACDPARPQATQALYRRLTKDTDGLELASAAAYREVEAAAVHIETPDPDVNRALAWATIALDQAWVCNPTLGCGLVAGYGPSRGLARRPQYDWFFAGDALVAIRALTLSGDFERARQALLFLIKYQNASNGMMWHEMSQSASYVDWAGSYPYMFPHVDITFAYLSTLRQYVEASGDEQTARVQWPSIQSAYRYCESIIHPADGLPRVPAGKEGGDEQGQPREELSLAVAWVEGAQGFSRLAALTGHSAEAEQANQAATRAEASIPSRFWDPRTNFWIAGFSRDGKPQLQMHSRPLDALSLPIFTQAQASSVLDTVSTSQFQTDWGTRSVGSLSPGFRPDSYATGSVWATSTAGAAAALWQQHRPLAAWNVWRTLLSWTTLDAMGHIHETLSGSLFQPQEESVPEQTWSSAMFLSSFVDGLLGIQPDALHHRLELAPHLPAEWNRLSVSNIRVGETRLKLDINRSPAIPASQSTHGLESDAAVSDALDLRIQSSGPALNLSFDPSIPLGAHISSAIVDGKPLRIQAELRGDDLQPHIPLILTPGAHSVHIAYADGIEARVSAGSPVVGRASCGIRIIRAAAKGDVYSLLTEVHSQSAACSQPNNVVVLNTLRRFQSVTGGKLLDHTGTLYRIAVEPGPEGTSTAAGPEYLRAKLQVSFAPTDKPTHP